MSKNNEQFPKIRPLLIKTPILSRYARQKKLEYFFKDIPKNAKILEIGCGDGWLGKELKSQGWKNYLGLDIEPPADIIGDIFNWKKLGLKKNSFDALVAFEVIEHAPFSIFKVFYNLLKNEGKLMLTSPVPHFDRACLFFEKVGLNQPRTSFHHNLIYFSQIPTYFKPIEIKTVGFITQWGFLKKMSRLPSKKTPKVNKIIARNS